MKKLIKYFLVLVLVVSEVYLIALLLGENITGKKEIETACQLKCAYNSNSYFWEFSGDLAIRGFTTKEECFNYCYKKEQGFAYYLGKYGTAFLGIILNK
ncbi:MAG: hypothetical protein LiPW30_737 [Parcubacteria group bacterium LiPW_30]|nr:MAG: hypothetical protein LiPW30_737 [Parcubacteria group bacterium LiPW_30]